MPLETHEREHEEARETRRWILELRAQIQLAKWAGAGASIVGAFFKWVA